MSANTREDCGECGSSEFQTNQDGETACIVCGMISESDNFDRRPNPSRSDSGAEKRRDSYTPRTRLTASKDAEQDDLIRIIPKPKSIKSKTDEKKEAWESIQGEFDQVDSDKNALEKKIDEIKQNPESSDPSEDYERIQLILGRISHLEEAEEEIRKRSNKLSQKEAKFFGENSTKQKIEQMRANTSARKWLSLTKNQDEATPNPESILFELNELEPTVLRWASTWESNVYTPGFLTELIWGNCVPKRSLMDFQGKKFTSDSRERIGLEAFIGLVGKGKLMWFFDDFGKRARLNPKLVSEIFSDDIPISRTAMADLQKMSTRSWDNVEPIRNFFSLCAKICGTQTMGAEMTSLPEIPIPPEEIWAKLGIGPFGEGRTVNPRYWVEREGRVPAEMAIGMSGIPQFERWGLVRRHSNPILLRHIPLAYFIAQEFWNRRAPEFRSAIARMRTLIRRDLEWCEATMQELDSWWEQHWEAQFDDTPSFTKMG